MELMIALSILSTILIMSTVILMQIGKWYSKGVNAANLQNTSRNLSGDVSAALQFGSGAPRSGGPINIGGETILARCISNVRYTYVLNRALGDDQGVLTKHVLWRDTLQNSTGCTPLNITGDTVVASSALDTSDPDPMANGFEMASKHMRLISFDIAGSAAGDDTYIITTRMGFGDSDVFNDPANPTSCLGGPSSPYCSLSSFSTTVKRRIEVQ